MAGGSGVAGVRVSAHVPGARRNQQGSANTQSQGLQKMGMAGGSGVAGVRVSAHVPGARRNQQGSANTQRSKARNHTPGVPVPAVGGRREDDDKDDMGSARTMPV
jgi:hypothetical protein